MNQFKPPHNITIQHNHSSPPLTTHYSLLTDWLTTHFSLLTDWLLTDWLLTSPKKVVTSLPAPTLFHPAPYSPPTACLSKSTGLSNPSLTPSMWIVSLDGIAWHAVHWSDQNWSVMMQVMWWDVTRWDMMIREMKLFRCVVVTSHCRYCYYYYYYYHNYYYHS